MSFCEDFYYEIYNEINSLGISREFYKQLEKMRFQDKHRYKTVKEQWEYAYKKVRRIKEEQP